MSLKINNRATPKQIAVLKSMDYYGRWDLSVDEAAKLITELFEERRLSLDNEDPDYSEQWYREDNDNNGWKE